MIIGITGCPGAGKSVAAQVLAEWGYTLIDADEIGREVVESDPGVIGLLAREFGNDIVRQDGTLDRRLTGQRAFASPESTEALNRIVHPALLARLRVLIDDARESANNTVVDCALIFEWGIEDWFDLVVCVHAPPDVRLKRLMDRDGRTAEDIEQLFDAQLAEDEKIRRSHIAFANEGEESRLGELIRLLCGLHT